MIFVDTNYFLRLLLKDVESQYKEAKSFFLQAGKHGDRLISSTVVFFEVFWVLRASYRQDKQALTTQLDKLLKLGVEFNERLILIESVNLFKELNLSLEDCYNFSFAKEKGAKQFKTFDQKLDNFFKK